MYIIILYVLLQWLIYLIIQHDRRKAQQREARELVLTKEKIEENILNKKREEWDRHTNAEDYYFDDSEILSIKPIKK